MWLLNRKTKPETVTPPPPEQAARRDRQQNIKVSPDCAATFAALARAQGLSKAALFEDLVAERLHALRQQGVTVGLAR